MSDAKPYPKSQQLKRGSRRYWRKVAGPKQWQAIIASKNPWCRICQTRLNIEYHHLVSRAQGGDDTAENIVPLCRDCHWRVTNRQGIATRALVASLTDAEYAYAVDKAGENVWERVYGITYERTP